MKTLYIDNQELVKDKKYNFLSSNVSSGSNTITVQSIAGFAVNKIILIGEIGQSNSEIILTNSVTSPSGDTITLATNLVESHSVGDKVTIIDYNQVEISWESGTTPDSDTILSTIDVQPNLTKTIYNDSTKSSGYYFVRYKDSINTTYSEYSDPIPYSGFPYNSVFSIKERALDDLGEEIDDKIITNSYLNNSLWEARRDLDNDKRIFRWSFRQKFNQNIGTIVPGTWRIDVPNDLKDSNTNKNILGLRIGRNYRKLYYQDQTEFNQNYIDSAHTTLNGVVSDSDVSIVLTDSGDFDESGNIDISGTTIDTVSYTANTESTNTLSGVTGIATGGHADGNDVWQGITFGEPTAYTIYNGYIYFDIPFEDDLASENIYMDYYGKLVDYDSDGDILDEPEIDMFVSYIKWKIKYKLKGGYIKQEEDPDYKDWLIRKDALISKEITGQEIRLMPDYE